MKSGADLMLGDGRPCGGGFFSYGEGVELAPSCLLLRPVPLEVHPGRDRSGKDADGVAPE